MRKSIKITAASALATLALAGCGGTAAAAASTPPIHHTAPPASSASSGYGVPSAPPVSRITGSCQVETLFDLPQYKMTLTNPTPYDITAHSWNVTFHNRNGSSMTIPVTAENGITVSGSESFSIDKMQPNQLTYDYNGTTESVATSCTISGIS